MAKGLTTLADIRRDEHVKQLRELPDRDLCEMVRAHFESHPTLPGEKAVKDQANQALAMLEDAQNAMTQNILQAKFGPKEAFEQAVGIATLNNSLLAPDDKEELVQAYAKTRIRETSLKEGTYYLDFRHFDPTELKRSPVDELPQNNGQSTVYVDKVKVELQKIDGNEVNVVAENSYGGWKFVGHLPDNFLKNNPMNVDHCEAELQLADYSNGNMKNLSAKVVVDTDLMSGDVVDLDESMLSGLDQDNGLQQ